MACMGMESIVSQIGPTAEILERIRPGAHQGGGMMDTCEETLLAQLVC